MSQPKTEHLLQGCLYFTTAKLGRVLTRWAEEAFSDLGLAPNYAFAVMLVNERPGITQTDLAAILHLTPSTLTRFIDKLSAKGWMTRTQDGRHTLLNPTPKSQANQPKLAEGWSQFWKRYTNVLGIDEGNGLAASIHKAGQVLEASEDPN
jgi:DNA-binding MarR family transcriptional regulator